jgi:hypothetical protein
MPINQANGGANGGFPPIVKCSKAELKIINENKNREFKGVKNAISIKDIMAKRISPNL